MKSNWFDNLYKGAQPHHFEFAKQMRCVPTEAENILWSYLSNKQIQGMKFRRQHPIDNFVLDFYCNQIKLSIEVDGEIHYNEKQREYDNERTTILKSHNIFELRFSNKEVKENIAIVLNEIEQTIRKLK